MIKLEPDPTPWDLKWRMLGFPVRVHPFFWLMALLLSYTSGIPFAFVLVSIACIFVSILVHEIGHAICQRYYGDRGNHVVLYLFGGLAIGQEAPPVWPRIAISLCGPGAEFVLGALAYGAKLSIMRAVEFAYIPSPGVYVYHALYFLVWISLIWGGLNLLPIFPLDGGQIVREIVLWKAPLRGEVFAFTISFYAAVAATLLALGWALSPYRSGGHTTDYYPVLLFAVLAWQSYSLRRQILEYGPANFDEDTAPRQPWEQNADWWKRGGR